MLGKFILEQRKKHNLTQDFLASKIGVSRPTYIQIEQGERDLTITEAKILSDIFGIVFDDFVQGKDTAAKVLSQVKMVIRPNYSSPPLHGARIAERVLSNKENLEAWKAELKAVAERIISMRTALRNKLEELKAPGIPSC